MRQIARFVWSFLSGKAQPVLFLMPVLPALFTLLACPSHIYYSSMSMDFIALFDVSSDVVNPEWMRSRLSSNPDFAKWLIDYFRDRWRSKDWAIESSSVTGESVIYGPGGFAIHTKPTIIQLYHMTPFRVFTDEHSFRDALRRACYEIAVLVGSKRVIYTHELMPYDGESLDEIEKGLRIVIGPPAMNFDELRLAGYFEPRAWYIDSFDDFR